MAGFKGFVKGLGLAGLVFGAYTMLNSNAAYANDKEFTITDATRGIKQCYTGDVKGLTKNIKKRNRERCAFSVIARYADSDRDGDATPSEIRDAVSRVDHVLAEDLKKEFNENRYVAEELEKAGRDVEGPLTDRKVPVVDADLEIVVDEIKIFERRYSVKYGMDGQTDAPYSEIVLEGSFEHPSLVDRRFTFHDAGDDDKFDGVRDCVDDGSKRLCGEDILKKSRAFVGDQETTSGDYLIELKKRLAGAYSQYLLKSFNKGKAKIDVENRWVRYKDNNFAFFVADSDKDGVTDTFVVKKKDFDGDVIMKIYGNRSRSVMNVIGGLYNRLISGQAL